MTLRHDNPQPKRPPMKTRTMWIVIAIASAVLIYAITMAVVSGKSFF